VLRSLTTCVLFACTFFAAAITTHAASAQTPRPLVYIEADPSGSARYVRVMERSYTAFTPARSILNLPLSPRINISDALATLVRGVRVRNAEYGVNVTGAGMISIDTFTFYDWNGGGGIHGAAIKIDRSTSAATYIQRVFADGREAPDASYDRSNTDFIGIERNSAPVFVRYATGRNFGDGGIDAKSNVAAMNVTIDGAHRGLRAWSNVTITIANSIINAPAGHEQVWVQGTGARVRYYNTLWCIGAETPSPNASECSYAPSAIGADDVSAAQARQQITALGTNTLASNSFFATQIDRVVVQYSNNGGNTWAAMASGGASGRAPLGDTRYRIPFNLSGGTYLFRAYFERNGARVGSPTTIDEAGQSVGA
jgi:hypothetical protein